MTTICGGDCKPHRTLRNLEFLSFHQIHRQIKEEQVEDANFFISQDSFPLIPSLQMTAEADRHCPQRDQTGKKFVFTLYHDFSTSPGVATKHTIRRTVLLALPHQ